MPRCWCGNTESFATFSENYCRCLICNSLVSTTGLRAESLQVRDDEHDFYGKQYWLSYQVNNYGYPDIYQRARQDLSQRCLYWLKVLLKYKAPPAQVLELGAGHGGFVALLRNAGFDATGLELSPWVVKLAEKTFDIRMLLGPLESQNLPAGSFDVIALMDVLEHLPDPSGTMALCLALLKSDGLLLIQTPWYKGTTYAEMQATQDRFLEHLKKANEHLYLFSKQAIYRLFERLGASAIVFEPAIFEYDMFLLVGKQPSLTAHTADLPPLGATPSARLVQALLDLDSQLTVLRTRYLEAEADRTARLEVIYAQDRRLAEMRRKLLMRSGLSLLQEGAAKLRRHTLRQKAAVAGAKSQAGSAANTAGPQPLTAPEFEAAYKQLRDPKKQAAVRYTLGAEDRLVKRLQCLGIVVVDYEIDIPAYWRYFKAAGYVEAFPNYYAFNLPEKSLEHFLAASLLELTDQDLYIDIASEHSPVPEIYSQLFKVKAYRQDLMYPAGIHGDRIGGNAAHMPVPAGFATKMALHCSFEHFEGEADTAFIGETARVLKSGGALCIVPLYLAEQYAIQTDPLIAAAENVSFEDDAILYCAKGWGNRHARFYDPERFYERVYSHLGTMDLRVYRIRNFSSVDQSCYARFAALIRKPADT